MRFPTMWYVRPAKSQISLCISAVWSEPLLSLEYSMTIKLLTEHRLEFLSLKGGCTGSSESTLVKMPHCWKSHVTAHISINIQSFTYAILLCDQVINLVMVIDPWPLVYIIC